MRTWEDIKERISSRCDSCEIVDNIGIDVEELVEILREKIEDNLEFFDYLFVEDD